MRLGAFCADLGNLWWILATLRDAVISSSLHTNEQTNQQMHKHIAFLITSFESMEQFIADF